MNAIIDSLAPAANDPHLMLILAAIAFTGGLINTVIGALVIGGITDEFEGTSIYPLVSKLGTAAHFAAPFVFTIGADNSQAYVMAGVVSIGTVAWYGILYAYDYLCDPQLYQGNC